MGSRNHTRSAGPARFAGYAGDPLAPDRAVVPGGTIMRRVGKNRKKIEQRTTSVSSERSIEKNIRDAVSVSAGGANTCGDSSAKIRAAVKRIIT